MARQRSAKPLFVGSIPTAAFLRADDAPPLDGGVGIARSSTLSTPYSILAGAIPEGKTGIYNFFIVIPEIIASLAFGWVMLHLLGNDRMMAGGGCLLIAALLTLRVDDRAEAAA